MSQVPFAKSHHEFVAETAETQKQADTSDHYGRYNAILHTFLLHRINAADGKQF